MRRTEDIRDDLLKTFRQTLRAPYPFSPSVDWWLGHLLNLLCFIDERDDELAEWRRLQEREGRFKEYGFASPFRWTFGDKKFDAEIASIYAESAYRFGFLGEVPALPEGRWGEIVRWAAMCDRTDRSEVDVANACGDPSLKIEGHTTVWAYRDANHAERWLCFDFSVDQDGYTESLPADEPANTQQRLRFRLLRDVRLPLPNFYDGFVLTPYGRRIASKRIHPDSKYPREKLT
jgi:hypothetical protein